MEYQQDLWGTRSVWVLHRTAVFHFQARSGIRRQGNEEPVADPDHKRKGDQSTESKRRLLYAVGQLPDGQICLYPAHGHGSLPALKAGGCLCDRVGALHCPAADLKWERDARKSAGPAPEGKSAGSHRYGVCAARKQPLSWLRHRTWPSLRTGTTARPHAPATAPAPSG